MSKNLYNYLNTIETKIFFTNQYFFIIKDSLSLNSNNKFKSLYFVKKQFIKTNFRIHLTSSFFMFQNIKFPLYIIFFLESSFFEEYFINFFLKKSAFLFFKYKSQLLSLLYVKYITFFDYNYNFLNLESINNSFIYFFFNLSRRLS